MGANTSTVKEVGNVYIFNKISNNQADVELLRETFQSLGCSVIEVKNQSYSALEKIVDSIVKAEAELAQFNYIVIIILDNENKDEHIWLTTDNKQFHINGDLITAVTGNPSLQGKLRFSIIQNNRIFTNLPKIRSEQKIRKQKAAYFGKDLKLFATSVGCRLTHEWNKNSPSPFIEILCEEINNNSTAQRSISDMLDFVSQRVFEKTNEKPCKQINFSEEYILGRARNLPM